VAKPIYKIKRSGDWWILTYNGYVVVKSSKQMCEKRKRLLQEKEKK